MSSKNYFLIFALIFLVVISIFIFNKNGNNRRLLINNHQIFIEVADTDSKRSKGLSGRKYLKNDSGMLFIFPVSGYYKFWMNEMQFPLDFVWIKDNIVVDITENVLPPMNTEIPQTFTAKSEFNKVLEINIGKISEWEIKVGDNVSF